MAQGNHTDKIFRESETMLRKVIEHPAFGTTEKEKEVTISYLGRARGRAHRAPIKIVKGQQSDQGIILIVQPAGNNTCCKVLFSVSGEQPEKVRQRLERVLPYLERKGGKWHLRSPDEKEEEEMTDKVTEEVLSAESQTQPPESPAKPRRWGRGDKREMAIEVIKEFVQTRAKEQRVTVEQVEFRSSEIIPKVEELCESTQDGSRALFENACKTLIREGSCEK